MVIILKEMNEPDRYRNDNEARLTSGGLSKRSRCGLCRSYKGVVSVVAIRLPVLTTSSLSCGEQRSYYGRSTAISVHLLPK